MKPVLPPAALLVGGDRRSLYLAHLLAERFSVHTLALGETGFPPPEGKADLLVLPVPATADGKTVRAPLWRGEPVLLTDALSFAKPGGLVSGGLTQAGEGLPALCRGMGLAFYDFLKDETFTRQNAAVTAEIALALAILETPGCLAETNAAVLGGGRIGMGLVRRIAALGGKCALFARSEAQRQAAGKLGARCYPLAALPHEAGNFPLLFNTIPAPVVGPEAMDAFPPDARLYELASAPGGFTPEALARRAVTPALSLPGKYAPRACAGWMAEGIFRACKEEWI